jgi:hypothetical protein
MINKSMRMRWVEHATCMEAMRNACKILIGKSEGNKLLVRHGHRWVESTEKDTKEK